MLRYYYIELVLKNPNGDQSDKTKPRLLITQDSGNYPAEEYYYRSSEEEKSRPKMKRQKNHRYTRKSRDIY